MNEQEPVEEPLKKEKISSKMRDILEQEAENSEPKAGIDAAREDQLTGSDSEEKKLYEELKKEDVAPGE